MNTVRSLHLRLKADDGFVILHGAGEAVSLDVLVDAVHTLHLLGVVDHRRKAYTTVADIGIIVTKTAPGRPAMTC